jgi:hypothetical protein
MPSCSTIHQPVVINFLKFMIVDGVLHSLNDEINPLLNLREPFGGNRFLALFVFFG